MTAPPITRWRNAVHFRWRCAQCGETHDVAVITRRGRAHIKLCESCYLDGFWRR